MRVCIVVLDGKLLLSSLIALKWPVENRNSSMGCHRVSYRFVTLMAAVLDLGC